MEDIVDEVKTTKEYVYKEKGKLKQEGLLVTQQSLSVSNGQNKITVVKDQPHLMDNVGLDRSWYQSILLMIMTFPVLTKTSHAYV